jgi:hypothetical protein
MLFELYPDCVAFMERMWLVAAAGEGVATGDENEGVAGGAMGEEYEGSMGGDDEGLVAGAGATGLDVQPSSHQGAWSDSVANMVDEGTLAGGGDSVMGESENGEGGDEATGPQQSSPLRGP